MTDKVAQEKALHALHSENERLGLYRDAYAEQEPVAHLWECLGRWSAYLVDNGVQADCAPPSWLVDAVKNATTPPQRTEQEPAAWIERDMQCDDFDPDSVTCEKPTIAANGWEWVALYTHPPQRTWIDLTDTQIQNVYFEVLKEHRNAPMPWGQVQFGRALLEKFKEVNQ